MKAMIGLLCDPCLHLVMIGLLLARLSAGVAPDDDERVAYAGPDATCPICKQISVHLASCSRPVIRLSATPFTD